MITWADVRRWDAAALGSVADVLNDRCTSLLAADTDVEGLSRLDGWAGDAATAAQASATALATRLERLVAELSAVRRGAHEGQLAVERLGADVRETDDLAVHNGFTIDDSGEVSTGTGAIRAELADRVEQILRQAADIDADLAALLARAAQGEITDQGATSLAQAAGAGAAQNGLTTIGPPPGATPGENRAWWDSLSGTAQGAILRDNPDLVRNLDGIPVKDRDAANRVVLQRETDRLKKDPSDAAKVKLQGLTDISARLASTGPGKPQAYLMELDPSGDGKAVAAAGNPDAATASRPTSPVRAASSARSAASWTDRTRCGSRRPWRARDHRR